MSEPLFIDFETRSPVDLPRCGAHVYFEHPETDVLMARYAFGDGPVKQWLRGDACPYDLAGHIEAGGVVSGWNVMGFERLAFENVLRRKYGWPVPYLDQYSDTAHMAAAMSLPRSLGDAAEALALSVQKDKEGQRLINKFSKPRRPRKGEDPNGLYWNEPEDHPEDFAAFIRYCGIDVETERAARKRLVPLSDYEQKVAVLNELVNQRGVRIDIVSANHAVKLAAKAKKLFDAEMRRATGGAVKACTQVAALTRWVTDQGVPIESIRKAELTDLLESDDLAPHVRAVLELRQEAGKTSVAKIDAMLRRANRDGRVRGTSLYHAAGTGRFQNVGVNTSNMARPRKEFEEDVLERGRLDVLFEAIKTEDPEALLMLYGPEVGRPMHLLSDSVRSLIWAAPGHEFVQADFSSIEGVVLTWGAGEKWKLQAMRELKENPELPDMYRRAAASIMGMTTDEITKKHPLRQSVGKVSELALGYQGAVAAFHSMARNYNVKLDPLFDPVWAAASEERREKAVRRYEGQLKRGVATTEALSRRAWIACQIITYGWRETNAAIVQFWRDLETCMRDAVANPGTVYALDHVKFVVKRNFLWMMLPSGRCLAYGMPRLRDQVWAKLKLPDGDWSDAEVMLREEAETLERRGEVKIEGATTQKVTALGVDSQTKKFRRYGLYGGLVAENWTQATARELLVNGMFKAEAAGYPVVMSVYDEILAEVRRGYGSVREFERLICELPAWAKDIPLQADGWRGKRYHK